MGAPEDEDPKYSVIDVPQDLAMLALDVQDASNLSGVVRSMTQAVGRLWEIARKTGRGTEWVNCHPVMVLFADKLRDLSRSSGLYSVSYKLCRDAVKTREVLERIEEAGKQG